MQRAHSKVLQLVIGDGIQGEDDESSDDDEPLPGSDRFEARNVGQPLTSITPYAHMWANHIPEQYVASKMLSRHFAPATDECKGECKGGGGLRHAKTEALERSNLKYFHQYFQSLDRRPADIMRRSGLKDLRIMFNPVKLDRSKYFCAYCGKGCALKWAFERHEAEECSGRPCENERGMALYLAAAKELEEELESQERAQHAENHIDHR